MPEIKYTLWKHQFFYFTRLQKFCKNISVFSLHISGIKLSCNVLSATLYVVFFLIYHKLATKYTRQIDRFALGSGPMVPMHWGLIDEPFVPHNLISAQESPVSLSKFLMAPRLEILMSSGSAYILSFSLSPSKWNPSRFPNGAPIEIDTCLQGILTYLLIYLFNISFRVPSKGALPPGPPYGIPSERDAPFLEPAKYTNTHTHTRVILTERIVRPMFL